MEEAELRQIRCTVLELSDQYVDGYTRDGRDNAASTPMEKENRGRRHQDP